MRYPSRFESRAGFFASTRDECLSPRVRLECNPEIPVAPGQEHWLLHTSLDEVYLPCSHSRAIPSFLSQLQWNIIIPWANTRGILNSPSNSRIPPQLEKNHVVPPSSQDEALSRYSVSGEVPRSEERRVGKECRSRWSP